MENVSAGSTAYLTATFRDKTGALAVPSTVTYKVDCLTTGTVILASTSATASSSVEFTLTPTINTIQTSTNQKEVRRVTVTGSYGASDAIVAVYDYVVINNARV